MLRSVQVLKQDADGINLEGQETAQYVKQQQRLDREERAAWRDVQKRQRGKQKRMLRKYKQKHEQKMTD